MSYCYECKYFTDEDVFSGYGRCIARNRAATKRTGYCIHFRPKKEPIKKPGMLDMFRWYNERAKKVYW